MLHEFYMILYVDQSDSLSVNHQIKWFSAPVVTTLFYPQMIGLWVINPTPLRVQGIINNPGILDNHASLGVIEQNSKITKEVS